MDLYPDNELIKKAYKYIKNIKESDRLKFNKLFKTTLVKAWAWSAASREMDDALLILSNILWQNKTDSKILKANDYVVEAIVHR